MLVNLEGLCDGFLVFQFHHIFPGSPDGGHRAFIDGLNIVPGQMREHCVEREKKGWGGFRS